MTSIPRIESPQFEHDSPLIEENYFEQGSILEGSNYGEGYDLVALEEDIRNGMYGDSF